MAPDDWAMEAAGLPLAFSQVREDPRLDLEIAKRLPAGAKVMMVASGGETAVCLARLPLAQLSLVDINPAQLALTRCKFYLASHVGEEESLALLGHSAMPSDVRGKKWEAIFRDLGLADDVLAEPSLIAALGPDHCGRYEMAFAELRRILAPQKDEISQFLRATDAASASAMIAAETKMGTALDTAFASALRLENLIALFGEGATHNPRRPFHSHFIAQLRDITARQPPSENPWIWQILEGNFPPSTLPDWLQGHAPIITQPEYIHSTMMEALAATPQASMDFIHLSNILDWLPQEEAKATLAAAHRVLRQGGYLIIRQLNSSLEIPSLFPSLKWQPKEAHRLQLADRSFFYPEILLATRS
ncbi:MAG: BtaA family protein [Akkermansiaceae bacterium]|jgi:S-adenosylmethionine-diacylglycerol 3-amino-3-carboxypropyl transferase|nr:BtaA family protein [Akkermansiaceae bacterium]MDP4646190.1 BtaA family protein [Akkermansiaceae bacterium]MDP4720701.1 BtaA family protein [Akkermansiaceae bacterium]MDP4780488.1 BtaA family protein [Akkermansiaceae bacterium]MDP4847271.1 BtaA family protein [Akkermansiaceae bacterium]